METPAVPLLAEKQQGYNDCFCLAQQDKQVYYVDSWDNLVPANKKGNEKDYYLHYHQAFEVVADMAACYKHAHGDCPTLSPSFYLENAKYNDLFVFVIDFDKMEDENGKKQPIDTEAPFFINAKKIADQATRSKHDGHHMYLAINKETATQLFASINLLASSGVQSYICKTGAITKDGRIKVDFFCDTPRLIYECEEWDITKGLTDKTQELYELIRDNFDFCHLEKRESKVKRTKKAEKTPKTPRTPRKYIEIAELEEFELIAKMDDKQKKIFVDLKTISTECSRTQWYSIGIDIYYVFGADLGGEVFFWWSKPYKKFDKRDCFNEWESICNKEEPDLFHPLWCAIMGLEQIVSEQEAQRQAEIQEGVKKLGERIQAERQAKMPADNPTLPSSLEIESVGAISPATPPLTFRGLPIQWEHEKESAGNALDGEEQSGNERHRILWGDSRYDKRDDFLRAVWGADYKKIREKVTFKDAAADNVLRLTMGQRTALEYDALYHRHINELVLVDEQDEKELFAFFASDRCTTAKETIRRLNYVDGVKKIATFGAGRLQTGAAEFTWCYTKEAIKGGNRYRGVTLNWSLWAYGIEKAYNDYLRDKGAKLWDTVRPAMYCQYQNGEVCRMTYAAEDYQHVESWVLDGCRGDFPLQGVTPDGDYEFTVMFDSEDVEYIDSGKVLGERNREQKTELAQARKTAKANKDWAAIRSHLEDDRQEFTTADLNSWGYSKNVITRLRKGVIKEVGVKRYVLENI